MYVLFATQLKSIWVDNSSNATNANVEWTAELQKTLAPHLSGAYVNYIDPLLRDWQQAYYGAHYDRLVAIKNSVDPTNFFNFQQSIGVGVDVGGLQEEYLPSHDANAAPRPSVGGGTTCNESALVRQMYAFQAGQNAMNAVGLALLYTPDGSNYIPASVAEPTVGRAAIQASFDEYFSTLESINETVVGPMIVNGNMGAFAKTIVTVPVAKSKRTVTHVDNWFSFDCTTEPPLIASFHAMFNATD